MEERLSPVEWAAHLNKYVTHKKFGDVLLIGLRTECESNNNLMLCIKDNKSESNQERMFWVYDYETKPIQYVPNLYL